MNNKVKSIIKEELNKSQINSMINDKLNSYVKNSEIDKKIKEVVADVMSKFFRAMYNKRTMWQGDIKNG